MQILFAAAQSAKTKEEAFKGHGGNLGAEHSHCAAGRWAAESCACARVSGATGRFLRCVRTNITTGKSSRFGIPWPQHIWHIWEAQGCNLPCFTQKSSSEARSRSSAPKSPPQSLAVQGKGNYPHFGGERHILQQTARTACCSRSIWGWYQVGVPLWLFYSKLVGCNYSSNSG